MQHNPSLYPAGIGVDIDVQPDGVYVTADIVEPNAIRLVEKKVLKAFSIGIADPHISKDARAYGGRIDGGDVVEMSIVDRPANPSCAFNILKSVDGNAATDMQFTVNEYGATQAPNGDDGAQGERANDEQAGRTDESQRTEPDGGASRGNEQGEATPRVEKAAQRALPEIARLHDMLCPGTNFEAFKAENPVLTKNGLASAIGPGTRQALWTMLSHEVDEDGGSGCEAYDIESLGKAYCNVCSFVSDEIYQEVSDAINEQTLLSVRADLAKDRQFYSNSAKEDVRSQLGQLHAILAKLYPDICSKIDEDLAEAEATKDTLDGDAKRDDAKVAEPTETKAAPAAAADDTDEDDDKDTDSGDAAGDGSGDDAPPAAAADKKPKKNKKGKAAKKLAALKLANADLQKKVDELGAQPDLSNAPKRAPANAESKKIAVDEVRKSEQQQDMVSKITFLRSLAHGGTAPQQAAARAELSKIGYED